MGQKVHPSCFRLKIVKDYENIWYSTDNYSDYLLEDYKLKNYLKNRLKRAPISKVVIQRKSKDFTVINLTTSRPGIILGKGGEEVSKLRDEISRKFNKKVAINVIEETKPDQSAKLLSEMISAQLEKRIPFRRAMKMIVQTALKSGVEGVQVLCSGRLGGVEIARSEWYQQGRMPLHTLRANIDYHFTEADTIYGKIGIKVWINNGEIINGQLKKD